MYIVNYVLFVYIIYNKYINIYIIIIYLFIYFIYMILHLVRKRNYIYACMFDFVVAKECCFHSAHVCMHACVCMH